jgi:uncharacterized protein
MTAPFSPRRWMSNGHVMTVAAWARRRTFPSLPVVDSRLIRVSDDTQVRADCFWQTPRGSRPTLLALHGLEGSSDAHYMRGLAAQAWRRGWNAVLLNQRNCGGTEHLTPGLYHSGLTADPKTVIRTLASHEGLPAFAVVGYSLGGNLTMKLAGELAEDTDLPVFGVAAVSPTIELERCVQAIERRANIAYHFNFVRNLKARMRRKALAWPGAFDLGPLPSIWTIRRFDDIYTGPLHGFQGASDYYHRVSAMRVVDRVRVPALILTAEDDPFVPSTQFREPPVASNPNITVRIESHGGHCGFLGDGEEEYWAEATAMSFLDGIYRRSELTQHSQVVSVDA